MVDVVEEGNNFTVWCVKNDVTVTVSAKEGFRLTTPAKQVIGPGSGNWKVVADDSIEDKGSEKGGSGSINYGRVTCSFSYEAELVVYEGDMCEAIAIVSPAEYGDRVSFKMDKGSVSAETSETGKYRLLISPSGVGESTLRAVCRDVELASTKVKSIAGEWKSSAYWIFESENPLLKMDDEEPNDIGGKVDTGTAGAKSGSSMGDMSFVPVGSVCSAYLTFCDLTDALSLPASHNTHEFNAYFENISKIDESSPNQVFDYFGVGGTAPLKEESKIELSPYVEYFWMKKEYNSDMPFQPRSINKFKGVGIDKLKIIRGAEVLSESGSDESVVVWVLPDTKGISVEAVSTEEYFPPDIPNGTSSYLENPKWIVNAYGESSVQNAGATTISVPEFTNSETNKTYTAYCGTSSKSVTFKRAEVDHIEVYCSHGRGGSNYLEVVRDDSVRFKAIWEPEEPVGVEGFNPIWEFSPSISAIDFDFNDEVNVSAGNPARISFGKAPDIAGSKIYTASLFGKSGTVKVYSDKKNEVIIGFESMQEVQKTVGNVLNKICDTVTFEEPKAKIKYSQWYEENPKTIYVGTPWELMLDCDPLVGIKIKAYLLNGNLFVVALKKLE